jgi:hypothetical protein
MDFLRSWLPSHWRFPNPAIYRFGVLAQNFLRSTSSLVLPSFNVICSKSARLACILTTHHFSGFPQKGPSSHIGIVPSYCSSPKVLIMVQHAAWDGASQLSTISEHTEDSTREESQCRNEMPVDLGPESGQADQLDANPRNVPVLISPDQPISQTSSGFLVRPTSAGVSEDAGFKFTPMQLPKLNMSRTKSLSMGISQSLTLAPSVPREQLHWSSFLRIKN